MKVTEIRDRQVQDGAAAQLLAGQIEDGEGSKLGFSACFLVLAAGDHDGRDEVARRYRELNIAVRPIGHGGIESDLATTQAQVQRSNRLLLGQC